MNEVSGAIIGRQRGGRYPAHLQFRPTTFFAPQPGRRPCRQGGLHRSARSWTYGQLAERVARFGHVLRKLGIAPEQRILLCLTDTIDWPTAFSRHQGGVVAVPVNTLLNETDYRFMLTDSRATLLVGVGRSFLSAVCGPDRSCRTCDT